MESIELFKEEQFKIDEHQKQCELTGKEVLIDISTLASAQSQESFVIDIIRRLF